MDLPDHALAIAFFSSFLDSIKVVSCLRLVSKRIMAIGSDSCQVRQHGRPLEGRIKVIAQHTHTHMRGRFSFANRHVTLSSLLLGGNTFCEDLQGGSLARGLPLFPSAADASDHKPATHVCRRGNGGIVCDRVASVRLRQFRASNNYTSAVVSKRLVATVTFSREPLLPSTIDHLPTFSRRVPRSLLEQPCQVKSAVALWIHIAGAVVSGRC